MIVDASNSCTLRSLSRRFGETLRDVCRRRERRPLQFRLSIPTVPSGTVTARGMTRKIYGGTRYEKSRRTTRGSKNSINAVSSRGEARACVWVLFFFQRVRTVVRKLHCLHKESLGEQKRAKAQFWESLVPEAHRRSN